jgi:hypothetical protein
VHSPFERRHGDVLDLAHRQLEEAAPELAEGLGVAGREEAVLAFAAALVLDALARKGLGHLAGRLLRREDERHVAAKDPLEDLADQRVVRAAEDHGVDPLRLQRRRVLAHGPLRLLAVRILALDQRHELRAGDRMERDAGVERVDEFGITARLHGRRGGEEADPPVARRLHGRVRLGRDHADDRHRQLLLQPR